MLVLLSCLHPAFFSTPTHRISMKIHEKNFSCCSQKFCVKWFSKADMYSAHIKLFFTLMVIHEGLVMMLLRVYKCVYMCVYKCDFVQFCYILMSIVMMLLRVYECVYKCHFLQFRFYRVFFLEFVKFHFSLFSVASP